MTVEIQLLGAPQLRSGGEPRALRGRKAWSLLAYLLCAERPATREHLAELLFPDAEDPLGALRWNLAELRRGLGPDAIDGQREVALVLPEDAVVDVRVLRDGAPAEAAALSCLGRELLEGVDASPTPAFDAWLRLERSRVRGMAEAALHEAALAQLAAGDPRGGAEIATRLVALNPFDENFHELLVRCHVDAGDREAARACAAACVELMRRELGREPSPSVAAAAEPGPAPIAPAPGRASTLAQLEVGTAAVASGSLEAGIATLRGAAAGAAAGSDEALLGRALYALGYALVHSIKGRDEEGATLLRRAALAAQSCGDEATGLAAFRELAYVEVIAGRYERALGLLARVRASADGNLSEQAAMDSISGMALADTGRIDAAVEHLERAIAEADEAGDPRWLAYALSLLGRIEADRGEHAQAHATLSRSLQITLDDNWLTFVPWPEALLGEVELALGEDDSAAERLAHAYALGLHFQDPCWEGLSERGLALLEPDPAVSIERLDHARRRSLESSDGYRWVGAHALDALCAAAIDHGDERAEAWIAALHDLAGRTGMREYVVSAYRHEAALGKPGAAEAAHTLAHTAPVEAPS
jgi:DNA-binding SARP family transcriptional activator